MKSRTKIQDIFGKASELAPPEREGYLDQACGDDDALRREVEELLGDFDAAGDFLEASFTDLLPTGTPLGGDVGRRIGDYVLIRPIGGGGMGHVYLAERVDDEFRQQVAVKLLRSERQEFLARFRQEREVLARLEHPHIARLYGGGAQDGRPYLVMEYVEGQRIDTFCEGHSVQARVCLLLKVCQAVAYAHSRLVVHRDIKPSNILVTDEGVPKLLDFGIAKPLHGASLTKSLAPMTLRYASPEQITGEPVTTATDVYGLGLLLFRLLTGELPYIIRSDNAAEVVRAIVEEDPASPSAQGAAEAAGDLDAIVLKALRKEPSERYPSVAAFSEDLERYLEGLPVQARGTDGWYWARKLARRYRWPLVAAMTGLVVVLGFLLVLVAERGKTARERDRAERQRDTAEQTLTLLKDAFKVTDPEFAHGREVTAREILDGAAPKLQVVTDPDVRATLLSTMGEVYTSLGLFDQAEPLLTEALELRRELGPRLHALGLYQRAELAWFRRYFTEAEALYQEALGVLPDRHSLERGRMMRGLGLALVAQSETKASEAALLDGLAELRNHFEEGDPEILRAIEGLAWAARDRGDYEAAAGYFQKVVAVLRRGGPGPALGRSLADLGFVRFQQGALEDARALLEEALLILRGSLSADNPYVAEMIGKLVPVLGRLGDDEGAERAIREILAILPKDHPGRGRTLHNLGMILTGQDKLEEAEQMALEALRVKQQVFGNRHESVALSLCLLGGIALERGDAVAARGHFEECATVMGKVHPPDHPQLAFAWVGLGRSAEAFEGCAEAVPWLRRAYDVRREGLGANHFQTAQAAGWLGACLGELNEDEQAEQLLVESWGTMKAQNFPKGDKRVDESLERLTAFFMARGREEELSALLRSSD